MNSDTTTAIAYLKHMERQPDLNNVDAAERTQIKASLTLIQQQSKYQMFGVLADNHAEAIAAIADYAKAFDYAIPDSPDPIDGGIYLKYNPTTGLCYCDSYTGAHRGVLVSFQSDYEDGVNEMFGHFPLDLYR